MKSMLLITFLSIGMSVWGWTDGDDGGACPNCGKITMKGGHHVCKKLKSSKSVEFGGSLNYIPQKNIIKNPPELQPSTYYSVTKGISDEIRKWSDLKGNIVEGSFQYISETFDKAWIKRGNGRCLCVVVSKLSASDRNFIDEAIEEAQKSGLVWHLGVFMTKERAKAYDYVDEAKKVILERDELAQRFDGMKVVSARKSGGYAMPLVKNSAGDYVPHPDIKVEVYYYSGRRASVADAEIIKNRRFYWAGTFEYDETTTYRNYWGDPFSYTKGKTTNAYSDDLKVAIYNVRKEMKLYDPGDPKFRDPLPAGGVSATEGLSPKIGDELTINSSGSGFFITKTGYVITNQHVVDGAKKVEVLVGGTPLVASVVQQDAGVDLALLKVDGLFENLEFSPNRIEKLGREVFTVGFPNTAYQGRQPKVNKGVISGTEGFKGSIQRYQIDAAIQPGNSGGPLCDLEGRVVGVVSSSLVGNSDIQNVNFAIKKSYLNALVESVPDCVKDVVDAESKKESATDFASVVEKVTPSCVMILNFQ